MSRLVDPEEIAFGSVDDDLSRRVSRAHGWLGQELREIEPVRLPEFGPPRELEIDADDDGQTSTDTSTAG